MYGSYLYMYCVPQVSGYEDILVETMNLCCHYFEHHMYMVPKEKYMLLKVSIVCGVMCVHVYMCTPP